MEKKQISKKKLLWILIPCLVVLLVAAGLGIYFLSSGAGSSDTEVKLYWNLDRLSYVGKGVDQRSSRSPRADSMYHIDFAVDGDTVKLKTADAKLVDYIDMHDVMGLVFDKEGYIVDYIPVEECGYDVLTLSAYVTNVNGNKITCNNSVLRAGVDISFEINENTKVYDIGSVGPLCGLPCYMKANDEIMVLTNEQGQVDYVFVRPYKTPGAIYWNLERMYNSTTGFTTREPDLLGYYTYTFAVNGEQVTLKTRSAEVATEIDKTNAPAMGLTFDEEGFIDGVVNFSDVTGGSTWSSWCDVLSIEGRHINTERVMAGTGFGTKRSGTMAYDCQIIDVSADAEYRGAYTELKRGDRIHCLLDDRGNVVYVFVVTRRFDGLVGWTKDRQYDAANKVTKRLPDAEGYYHFVMSIYGEERNLKTKDKAIMDAIESFPCYVVKLDGDEVIKVSSIQNKYWGNIYSYYYITGIDGNKLSLGRYQNNQAQTQVATLAEDVRIFDVDSEKEVWAQELKLEDLRVGDRIYALPDILTKEVKELYVTGRSHDVPAYWNLYRKYDSTKKETTRVPDSEGYYNFTMGSQGKQVVVRTKSKDIANQIDSVASLGVGLSVGSGNVIQKVYALNTVVDCQVSSNHVSWVDVISVSGRTIVSKKNSAGHADDGKIFTTIMAPGCKVYNMDTDGFIDYAGEKTTVRVGDRIQVMHNVAGEASHVFIVSGRVSPVRKQAQKCVCTEGTNVTWQPWDGTTELKHGNYYYLTQDVVAPKDGFAIDDEKITIRLDGHTISSEGRCFYVKIGGQLSICDHNTRGKLIGAGVAGENGGVIRMATPAGTMVKLWNIDVESTNANQTNEGGLVYVHGPVMAHNVNFVGGNAKGKGGAAYVTANGTLETFGCTFTGGTTEATGGNLDVHGRTYLEDTKIAEGTATGNGDNIYISSTLECAVKNLTVTHTAADAQNLYFQKGTLGVSGVVTVNDANTTDLFLNRQATLVNQGLATGTNIGLTAVGEMTVLSGAETDLSGMFTMENCTDLELLYDAAGKRVWLHSTQTPVEHTGAHCLCVGKAMIPEAGHTCAAIGDWQELTMDVLTESKVAEHLMFKKSGNYYLTTNQNFGGIIDILPDQNITICLNGRQITGQDQIFLVAGKLNITDCRDTGMVAGSGASGGGCIKLVNGGVVNQYSGVISAVNSKDGPMIVLSNDTGSIAPAKSIDDGKGGTMDNYLPTTYNLYGGELSGAKAAGSGASLSLWHKSTFFHMYGGTITGGKITGKDAKGGNIVIGVAGATARIYGGTITGGEAETNGGNIYIKGGSLYMYGGTITGGKSGGSGGNIIIGGSTSQAFLLGGNVTAGITNSQGGGVYLQTGTLTLGGNATISGNGRSDIYLAPKKTITIDENGWAPTAQSLLYADDGVIATNAKDPAVCNAFTASGRRSFVHNAAEMTVTKAADVHTAHCLCAGAQISGLAGHTCSTVAAESWTPMTTAVLEKAFNPSNAEHEVGLKFKEDGYYVLTNDMNLSKGLCIMEGQNITLCLHGYTLSYSGQTFRVAGELTIVDCNGNGKVIGSDAGNGGCVKLVNGGTFNLYGGNLSNTKAVASGGGVVVLSADTGNIVDTTLPKVGSTFNMYGGTLTGGIAENSNGGNLSMFHSGCVFNMYGGTIADGKATGTGKAGNINVTGGKYNLLGGTVSGGQSETVGESIFYNSGQLVLGGNVQINKIDLNNKVIKIHDSGLTTATPITVIGEEGVFATNVKTDLSGSFASGVSGLNIGYDAAGKTLFLYGPNYHGHCLCVDAEMNAKANHSCSRIVWKPFPKEEVEAAGNTYTLAAGDYYLTDDVTFSGTDRITIAAGTTVRICLNGNRFETNGRFFVWGTLEVTDCSYDSAAGTFDGQMVTKVSGKDGALATSFGGARINIYGGNFTGTGTAGSGGVFYVSNQNGLTKETVMNLYNGKIYGGTAKQGGNIYVALANGSTIPSVLNIYGGEISGGLAVNGTNNVYGGNIYSAGTVNMYGGTVKDPQVGTAVYGGNICVTGTVNMEGGTIANGVVSKAGGNLYINHANARVYIKGGQIYGGGGYDNTAGGNIRLNNGLLEISNGKIWGGRSDIDTSNSGANVKGSCIYVTTGTFTMTGGSIGIDAEGNVAGGDVRTGQGGNIYIQGGTVSLSGGTIAGGNAKDGGNIYSEVGFTLGDGMTIQNGTASGNGSGVYLKSGVLTLGKELSFSGNSGADIFLNSGATLALNNEGLTVAAPIKVSAADGKIATNAATDLSACFESAVSGKQITWNESEKALYQQANP